MRRHGWWGRLGIGAALIAGMLPGAGGAAAAQKNVLVLLSRSVPSYNAALEGFKTRAPFKVELLNLEKSPGVVADLPARTAAGEFDAVVAIGTEAALTAGKLNLSVPVVYTMVLQPLKFPASNFSGVLVKIGVAEQLARIHKLLPGRSRIGVIYNPDYSGEDINLARKVAGNYNLTVYAVPVVSKNDIDAALGKMTADMVDALWMVVDEMTADPAVFAKLSQQCNQQKMPLIGLSAGHVKAGALAAFCADFSDVGAQTAEYVQTQLESGLKSPVATPRKVIVYFNEPLHQQLKIGDVSEFPDAQIIR